MTAEYMYFMKINKSTNEYKSKSSQLQLALFSTYEISIGNSFYSQEGFCVILDFKD